MLKDVSHSKVANRIDILKTTLNTISQNYEAFVASGCSVHEFNRIKLAVDYSVEQAEKLLEKDTETALIHCLRAGYDLGRLSAWVGRRINVVGTSGCLNCNKEQYKEGWEWFCKNCDKAQKGK